MHMYRSDRLYLDQCKHSWEGQGAHHNFFFYGVVRERDGGRKRCFLWKSVYGTLLQRRRRRLAATAFWSSDSQLEERFILELQEISSALFDVRPVRSRHRLLPALRQSAQAILAASRCAVWRNGHHGTVVLLCCFHLLPYHHVLHSRSRRCLQIPAPHVEGVVQAKKKVWVQGLMQRAHPGLVGSSRGWKHQLNLNHQEFTVWHQKALDKDRKVHH